MQINYEVVREWNDKYRNILDYSKPIFTDTETGIHLGKTSGGLFGYIRLVQLYQDTFERPIIFDCQTVDLEKVLEILKPGSLVFHNASYDLHTINLYTSEYWYPKKVDDTFYLSKLTFFDKNKFDFFACLKYAKQEDEIIRSIDKKENQKADWAGAITSTMYLYAACDVIYLAKLYPEVIAAKDTDSYKLDIDNLKYAIEYSRRGIPVNVEKVKKELVEVNKNAEILIEKLPVNPNSSKQCQELLGVSSADEDTLVKMKLEGSSLAGDIVTARKLLKRRGYLVKYSRPIIKGFYNPCGTISGRFSCTGGNRFDHENLQTMPRDVLKVLEAPDGYVFVYKDYSQLELRMGVAYTGEPTMEHLYRIGKDLHTFTASAAYNVKESEVTKTMRLVGKVLNFLTIYGGGAKQAQSTLRAWGDILMPLKEVSQFQKVWFETYPYFKEWHNITKRSIDMYKYMDIETALGRKIRTYSISDALNLPIQGSSSEVQKTALILLKERYPKENLISTIHDSNTLLAKEDEAEDWRNALNECMVDAWFMVTENLAIPDLPMPAEAEIGKTWEF